MSSKYQRERMYQIQYHREARALRIRLGICQTCGAQDAVPGKTHCAACLERSQARNRARRQRLREAGLCRRCGKRPAAPDRTCCAACLTSERTRTALRRARQKENAS